MAPERFRGEGDARADIYALGLTLYELLTLRPAFETSDRLQLIERIKTEEPARPRSLDARIPRDLETIVLKAIDKDPERRYATAEAMAEDLRRFLARRADPGAADVGARSGTARWARQQPDDRRAGRRADRRAGPGHDRLAHGRGPDARAVARTERIGSPGGEPPGGRRIQGPIRGRNRPHGFPGRDLPRHAQRGSRPCAPAASPAGATLRSPTSPPRRRDFPQARPARAANRGRRRSGYPRRSPRRPDRAFQRPSHVHVRPGRPDTRDCRRRHGPRFLGRAVGSSTSPPSKGWP